MHQNGVGNGAVSVFGGMAARYRSGYLVSGGVKRSFTQKPWRPETGFTRRSIRIPKLY